MNLIHHLNWRYATKLFDPNKKISEENLELLKEAVRLSVSSYGLQLYKILIIEDQSIRQKLREHSYDQPQITDSSQLFVFCNYNSNFCSGVEEYIDLVIETNHADSENLKNYGKSIKEDIRKMSSSERNSWSEKQCYVAMNNLLMACAELRIDSCPMEGFDSTAYNEILGLRNQGLNAAIIVPVGYRSVQDKSQFRKKVRKENRQLFELI
ncbi:NAD(P)H-dependent oxidoreductase [Algoriphagus sp. CAU 1675]|uniref:NAD(P)H-dependent oxidoreductase n=1 Tax=Algoriphagus sp. CAU 1675 TaxID=3032597 RepID=UPI0023DCA1E7|nr:NAD(P)H-dependent oxidoreductase [Algoriphagus sp. CAU 1675]MDF2157104.1 NAD(P)H-dependent oxidoreductase [Algoriphagus sp. CAU 1675]